MATTDIVIRGAREHNLRDVSLELPRGQLICFTGVSGSGKSSLAFDTLYAEGQRRYVESLSSYARQFLGQMPKPEVDRIDGLSPSISIQQKTGGRNPRSTVGTITEINDYLRVLFARVGQGHCPKCDRPVAAQTREQIVARVLDLPAGTAYSVMAPVIRGQKGEYKDLFADLARAGYVRARVNGQVVLLTDKLALDRQTKHNIEVVIDRLKAGPSIRPRLTEAVEAALKLGEGAVLIAPEGQPDLLLSSDYACAACGLSFDPPSPQLFSFNSPQGMCLACDGLGVRHDFDPALLVPDPSLSVWEGAIEPLGPVKEIGKWRRHLFEGLAANLEADPDGPPKGSMLKGPWKDLEPRWRNAWLYGTGDRVIVHRWKNRSKNWSHAETWAGVATELLAKFRAAQGGVARAQLEPYMRSLTCPDCDGGRLNPRARAVRVGGKSLVELGALPIGRVARFFDALADPTAADLDAGEAPVPLDPLSMTIADELLKEIRGRLAVPDRRRPALPGPRPRRPDALRRRGPAHPARQPGGGGARRGPLHPRRALDRPASARQRQADRHAPAAPRRGEHGHRRRARRGHDARGRPPGRLRARPRRQGGGHHRRGDHRRPRRRPREPHRAVPLGAQGDRGPARPQGADREAADDRRGQAEQPQGDRRRHPARPVRLHHRGLGLGQELADRRHPPRRPGPRPQRRLVRARGARPDRRASMRSTRSSTSTSRRSAGPRARTRPPTSSSST